MVMHEAARVRQVCAESSPAQLGATGSGRDERMSSPMPDRTRQCVQAPGCSCGHGSKSLHHVQSVWIRCRVDCWDAWAGMDVKLGPA